ncbi:MAG: hypothetical protein AB1758_08260 [Candidatus Eremiobacterota bacterium]
MSEEDLRDVIETNFKLVGMSLREMGVRSGKMEQGLAEVRSDFEAMKTSIQRAGQEIDQVRQLALANQAAFNELADRLDQTLEALKTLAFSEVESKKRLTTLETQMTSVLERLDRLDPAV